MKAPAAVALSLFFFAGIGLAADENPKKRGAVERLMEVSGITKTLEMWLKERVEEVKADVKRPEWVHVPPQFFDVYMRKVEEKWQDLINAIIASYEKHYTMEELKAATTSYKSSAGKKMTKKMRSAQNKVFEEIVVGFEHWKIKIEEEAFVEVWPKGMECGMHPVSPTVSE